MADDTVMAQETMKEEAQNEETDEEEPARRLIESTLWKEDAFVGDHQAVWGSLYDSKAKRWGYACCRSFQRESSCVAAAEAAAAAEAEAKKAQSSEEYSPDSDDFKDDEHKRPIDWSNPPPEILPRQSFKKASDFVEHFIRYAVGAWQKHLDAGFVDLNYLEKQAFEKTLPDTKEATVPLLRRLRRGESLEKGERKENRGRSRETRTSMEGKFLGEAKVLDQLETMATNAHDREYVKAHKAYMMLTLGHKTWNNTCVQHVAACTMKGAREYRRNRDNLNTYDMDPVSQRYMHAMRKLVHFVQVIRPSDDQSKNVVL